MLCILLDQMQDFNNKAADSEWKKCFKKVSKQR